MAKTNLVIDVLDKEEVISSAADLKENNEYITETAGFVPLEVKLKQFETNGLVAQFMTSDFDSNDYRDIYLNPDFNISPEDDFEDIQEKLQLQREYAEKIKVSKNGSFEKTAVPPSDSAAANYEKTVPKDEKLSDSDKKS